MGAAADTLGTCQSAFAVLYFSVDSLDVAALAEFGEAAIELIAKLAVGERDREDGEAAEDAMASQVEAGVEIVGHGRRHVIEDHVVDDDDLGPSGPEHSHLGGLIGEVEILADIVVPDMPAEQLPELAAEMIMRVLPGDDAVTGQIGDAADVDAVPLPDDRNVVEGDAGFRIEETVRILRHGARGRIQAPQPDFLLDAFVGLHQRFDFVPDRPEGFAHEFDRDAWVLPVIEHEGLAVAGEADGDLAGMGGGGPDAQEKSGEQAQRSVRHHSLRTFTASSRRPKGRRSGSNARTMHHRS